MPSPKISRGVGVRLGSLTLNFHYYALTKVEGIQGEGYIEGRGV